MSVGLSFTAGQANLVIWGEDGNVLLPDHAEVSSFQRAVPTTQDYYIQVKGARAGVTRYSMTVTIPAVSNEAERIQFNAGSTSVTVTGQLDPSGSRLYVLHTLAGQTMSVQLAFTAGGRSWRSGGQTGMC